MKRFLDAYIACAVWSSSSDDGTPLDHCDATLSADAVAKMTLDCSRFLGDVQRAGLTDVVLSDFERAGHDFWLTRNGHGAGFWDGDWAEHGDALTKLSKAFPAVDLYVGDDSKIYQT